MNLELLEEKRNDSQVKLAMCHKIMERYFYFKIRKQNFIGTWY